MRKILLFIAAIMILVACSKEDNKIPIPKPFPEEEQNRLIKELAGYWENCEKGIFEYDYAYTENFTQYNTAQYTSDTFVLPRISRLREFQLSPGFEIEGHQTIWIDETQSSEKWPTEFYYIKNDSLHIYRNYGIYTWEKGKLDIAEHKIFKRRKDVQFIKEEDINKELIGKWVNEQRLSTFEFFDDFTIIFTNSFGTQSNDSYNIRYGTKVYGIMMYEMRCDHGRDFCYNRNEHYVLYDNDKYRKQE